MQVVRASTEYADFAGDGTDIAIDDHIKLAQHGRILDIVDGAGRRRSETFLPLEEVIAIRNVTTMLFAKLQDANADAKRAAK